MKTEQATTVTPGTYAHFKGKKYTVLGAASCGVTEGWEFLGYAVRSGTEDQGEARELVAVSQHADQYAYAPTESNAWEAYGTIVLYRPDYGSRELTFRPIAEFFAEVPGKGARFTRVDTQ